MERHFEYRPVLAEEAVRDQGIRLGPLESYPVLRPAGFFTWPVIVPFSWEENDHGSGIYLEFAVSAESVA